MDTAHTFTLILIMAELFEAHTQRASTLMGILSNLYHYYRKSIFLFFLVQPGFYTLLFIVLYTGTLNASMVFLLALKVFDMFYKIDLIQQVFIKREVSVEIGQMLEWKIPSWFTYMGLFTYPPLLFFSLS